MRFKLEEAPKAEELPKPARAWTGLLTRIDAGRLIVTQVRRGTPGHDAGVNVEDEILAIDDYRVRADQWEKRLSANSPGSKVDLLVARRDALVRLSLIFAQEPRKQWQFQVDPKASEEQKRLLRDWTTVQ